jgi:hypothetical protein
MVRASVPKAAVEEDRNPLPRENDVRSYAQVPDANGEVFTEPETEPMHLGPEYDLRARTGAPVCTHQLRHGL